MKRPTQKIIVRGWATPYRKRWTVRASVVLPGVLEDGKVADETANRLATLLARVVDAAFRKGRKP